MPPSEEVAFKFLCNPPVRDSESPKPRGIEQQRYQDFHSSGLAHGVAWPWVAEGKYARSALGLKLTKAVGLLCFAPMNKRVGKCAMESSVE